MQFKSRVTNCLTKIYGFPEQIEVWSLFENFTVKLMTVNATTVYFSLFLGLIEYKKYNICVCYHYDAIIIFWQVIYFCLLR